MDHWRGVRRSGAALHGMGSAALAMALAAGTCLMPPDGRLAAHAVPAPSPSPSRSPSPKGDAGKPVVLHLPSVGVSTRVIGLRLDRRGRLAAPERFDVAGWNVAGPEPGEPGVSVVAGHVDSRTGPAVFHRLRHLRRGDAVHVVRADGTSVTFTVRRLARYPKTRIPGQAVYGAAREHQLRLIAYRGGFDPGCRGHRDDLVVFADRARTSR
ncbi:class F sortase [Spongiactinospora rosea]|uniref:Class F sortase n=1 Tax=Spongiactinospora rosea TaxID=2248750 RepID=A0A366LYP4_9ACTN|nr:sortase [Spongiactinospora rosea]RBQ18434.1 class F sortase [Spongiactinospora rosea]